MKLSIHFRLRLNQSSLSQENKKITIRCHLNIDGQKEIPFSTGRCIELHRWSQESERVINDNSWEAQNINNQLNKIYDKLFKLFDYLQSEYGYVDSVMLKEQYDQTLIPPKKAIEYYDEYLESMLEKRNNPKNEVSFEDGTFRKWQQAKKHFENYLETDLKKSEIYLNHITTNIGDEYFGYLKLQKNKNGKAIQKIHAFRIFSQLKNLLDLAVKDRFIKENPLNFCKINRPSTPPKDKIYLEHDNLMALYDCKMLTDLERGVVDVFIFMSFSTFTYGDYCEFRADPKKYIFLIDNKYFIKKRRFKDKKKENPVISIVPFMKIHQTILERYNYELPNFPCETINKNIKIIAQRLKIKDALKITSYTARKSTGTMYANEDGVEPKTLSRMMGHSKPDTVWEFYAQIVDQTVMRQTGHLALSGNQ